VWDADGREYVDLLGGIAVNALGHAHPALVAAVTEQLGTLGHISNFFTSTPQVELAERLLALVGAGGRVFFTNSGAEANEAAFKLTRRTGRTHLVAAEGAFHGRTMGALALTSKEAYRAPFEPLPGDVTFVPYGDEVALARAVTDQTAAVILEPIQGEAGVVVPPDGYLAAAREITRDQGALLWLDEIQTGIGRTGEWFAGDVADADVVTVAKKLEAWPRVESWVDTASTRAGWAWPRALTAMPASRSTYSLPSASQTWAPRPRTSASAGGPKVFMTALV
jgi:acetylornithine aminotransferase